MTFLSKSIHFLSRRCIWKCPLWNGSHFAVAWMCHCPHVFAGALGSPCQPADAESVCQPAALLPYHQHWPGGWTAKECVFFFIILWNRYSLQPSVWQDLSLWGLNNIYLCNFMTKLIDIMYNSIQICLQNFHIKSSLPNWYQAPTWTKDNYVWIINGKRFFL